MNIEIKKPMIKSPKSTNKLSHSLKSKLNSKVDQKKGLSNDNSSINTHTKFKKIKLTPKSSKKKLQNRPSKLFLPIELSIVRSDIINDKKKNVKSADVVKPNTEAKTSTKPNVKVKDTVIPNVEAKISEGTNKRRKLKKSNKARLSRRKKSTRNKVISVDLNNNTSKEKDIIDIINKFEKMDVNEIKTFLKNKGINTKNTNKSKLMPYLYLLTCVDGDINIIKS
tara:strand:- start:894 stop:1565 length:672 start_codon:yes stop_codon:yes gene_type:complete